MSGVFRIGVVRILGRQQPLLNAQNGLPAITQKCNISGKSIRQNARASKPKPFPYKEKKYNLLAAMLDKTTKRLDENSKIICVEGPVAAGKSKFAKELADELEMLYVPEA